jgi:serine phosphatase RsbU (regulator of sigma subunit)
MEYVNAGHTDLLLRREGKSRSMVVKPKDRDIKGHFLGLDMMQNTFESISFKVRPGDTLLLYSDCAIETHDQAGEEFGMERLCDIFDSMPDGYTPSDLLTEIVRRLEEHAGAEGFKDDLTMIILRRLG